ncbi:unnamed protein product [Penicillium roqueforti FM164]|uniref:Uncharacterized protein n=1 Tax=Penicillium roqueforti (strain FM164) TaxID=1365484 RepID=W6R442_PENRF|nr:unnamed protein product [Penicillium roqueforti FM164]
MRGCFQNDDKLILVNGFMLQNNPRSTTAQISSSLSPKDEKQANCSILIIKPPGVLRSFKNLLWHFPDLVANQGQGKS